jgi:hypothetical protein
MEIDDPEELARGELKEELGLGAAKMVNLGFMWIAYGFLRQKIHIFVATGLTAQQPEPDAEEHDLVTRNVPVAEFEQMMLDGTIHDSTTLSAWGMYQLWRSKGNAFSKPAVSNQLSAKAYGRSSIGM